MGCFIFNSEYEADSLRYPSINTKEAVRPGELKLTGEVDPDSQGANNWETGVEDEDKHEDVRLDTHQCVKG